MEEDKKGRKSESPPGQKSTLTNGAEYKESDFKGDLPRDYDTTTLVLMPIDPYSLYVYWRVTPEDLKAVESKLGPRYPDTTAVLRLYTQRRPQEEVPSLGLLDIEVEPTSGNHTLHAVKPGLKYAMDLGFKTKEGDFFPLIRSGPVMTPRSEPIGEEGKHRKAEAQLAGCNREVESEGACIDITSLNEQAFETGFSSK